MRSPRRWAERWSWLLAGALFACSEAGDANDGALKAWQADLEDEGTATGAGERREEADSVAGLPRPGQRRGEWAVALNARCEGCHAAEAQQWQRSRHRRADTNAAYRAAFVREGASPFCTSCHAPEARDVAHPSAAESALGVGCVSCHVVGDDDDYAVLAGGAARERQATPHRLLIRDDFAMTGGCAACHEFRFPGRVGERADAFMQTTVRELEQIAGATTSCAECHMPMVDGRRSHGFEEVRTPAWLRAQLHVSARLDGEDVEIRLSQSRPGHAFPTGDLFRRLQVGATWLDVTGKPLGHKTAYLARHFVLSGDSLHRRLTADDRVKAGIARLVLERPEAAARGRSLRWWVSLQRVATVGDGRDPDSAEIESEVLLHGGTLKH